MGEKNGTDVLLESPDATTMEKTTDVAPTEAKKEPPPEKREAIKIRTLVITSFWAVILFLGLPMWWRTTSIYRARLPLQEMMDWADGKVRRT